MKAPRPDGPEDKRTKEKFLLTLTYRGTFFFLSRYEVMKIRPKRPKPREGLNPGILANSWAQMEKPEICSKYVRVL